MVLNTIICLVRKINPKLIVTYDDRAKFGETYHGQGTSHQLLQKFRVDILKHFEAWSAPFLLTR